MYYYTSTVTNWHVLECTEVKDMDSDMARLHGRQKPQAPTHPLKVKGSNKRPTIKVYVK